MQNGFVESFKGRLRDEVPDHVPLYRQAQIYARQDIRLDRSTLAD